MATKWILGLCALTIFAGCGGTAPNQVNGDYHGAPITMQDAISHSRIVQLPDAQGTAKALSVILSSAPNACERLAALDRPKNGTELYLSFNGDLTTGTYQVTSSLFQHGPSTGLAYLVQSDSKCVGTRDDAISGTMTLSRFGENDGTGTFDLTFQSGAHLTGNFSSTSCGAVDTVSTAPSTCS
jgi:hypothetical protein